MNSETCGTAGEPLDTAVTIVTPNNMHVACMTCFTYRYMLYDLHVNTNTQTCIMLHVKIHVTCM